MLCGMWLRRRLPVVTAMAGLRCHGNARRACSSAGADQNSNKGGGKSKGDAPDSAPSDAASTRASQAPAICRQASINNVTLVGVVHDIQTGYVFEDAVTQFTLTTTSLDSSSATQDCVVEKDHHTIRCFGDGFSQEVRQRIKEGNVLCVNGRLRLNPQLEASCNKYYYFPYIHVQPPHGQVSVVYGDRRAPPSPTSASPGEAAGKEGAK